MRSILFLVVMLLFVACGKENKQSVVAPVAIEESFFSVSNDEDTEKKSDLSFSKELLVIQKKALEKEFLLRAQLIEQLPVPSFNGLQSRIVAFRKKGKKIYMLETNDGHQITDQLPKNLLLAEFKIIRERKHSYVIDFNAGMNKVMTFSGWNASDFDGSKYNPAKVFGTADINVSYIEEIKKENETTLSIRQLLQAKFINKGKVVNTPLEMKYYLSSYKTDTTFDKKKSTKNFDRYGFFETNPRLEAGIQDVIYYTKFNHKKKITFAISSNTPAEYRQAVRDGILYWNKALGKNIIEAIDAPVGMTAPNVNYNIVQWVNWDSAGFAYADAQMDPRNGEILNAQVFMTSVFGFSSKGRVRALLKKLKANQGIHIAASLDGKHKSKMCAFGYDENYTNRLISSLSGLTDKDNKLIAKASQDYIREVIAHEIGHTLGFRHNFAASTAANFSVDVRDQRIKDYLDAQGVVDGSIIASSSVMEYQRFYESIASGSLIMQGKVFEYDKKAAQILYNNKEYSNDEMPLYCTDSHANKFIDCQRFDIGQSFVKAAIYETQDGMNHMAESLLENYARAKAPGFGRASTPVEAYKLSPKAQARALMKFRDQIASTLAGKMRILSIDRKFPYVTDFFKEELEKDYDESFAAQIRTNGGLRNLFKGFSDEQVQKLTEKTARLLETKYSQGVNRVGENFVFTQEEREKIKVITSKFYKLVQKEFNKLNLKTLSGKSLLGKDLGIKFKQNKVGKLFEGFYAELVKEHLLATDGIYHSAMIKFKGDKDKMAINLPAFKHKFEKMELVAGMLSASRGATGEWGFEARREIKQDFKALIKKTFGAKDMAKVDTTQLDYKSKLWLDSVGKVLKKL